MLKQTKTIFIITIFIVVRINEKTKSIWFNKKRDFDNLLNNFLHFMFHM